MKFNNRNPKIFVLSGKSGNGKTEVAKFISSIISLKEYKKTISLAYACPLKEYAKNILNWDGNEITKPRDFLQQIGVELIKNNIDNKMLINRLLEDIKVYSYFYDVIIISDARFPEEIDIIRDSFKDVVVVHICGLDGKNNLTDMQRQHATEVSLDNYSNYDYEINNIGTLYDLKQKVESIISEVEKND